MQNLKKIFRSSLKNINFNKTIYNKKYSNNFILKNKIFNKNTNISYNLQNIKYLKYFSIGCFGISSLFFIYYNKIYAEEINSNSEKLENNENNNEIKENNENRNEEINSNSEKIENKENNNENKEKEEEDDDWWEGMKEFATYLDDESNKIIEEKLNLPHGKYFNNYI